MKLRTLLLSATLVALPLSAQVHMIDKAHSEATFGIRHLLSTVSGKFNDFSGHIDGDPAKPAKTSVTFEIKAASIDTGNADRDKHLRSADFFDVEKCPAITFKSTAIKPTGKKDLFNVTGDLTMHCVTRKVTLPVQYRGSMKDPFGPGRRSSFHLTTALNRKDYGINWNKALDNGGTLLSDDVDITVNLETVTK